MDDFLYGFPPPPIFYENYCLKSPNQEIPLESKLKALNSQINEASGPIFNYEKLQCFEGPPAPAPPTESWYSFGTQEKFREDEVVLDSETYIAPEAGTGDLRQHFKNLYAQFLNSLITYLDHLKNMNGDSISEIKRFVKLYINLQYILSSLWRQQAEEDVLDMFKQQLAKRRRYLDSMKLVLLHVNDKLKNCAVGH